jgi:polyferredoxin
LKPSLQRWRHLSQFLFLFASLGWLLWVIFGNRYTVHHGCPYATVCFGMNRLALFALWRTAAGIAAIFGLLVLVWTMFRGRSFCAWICPLGTAQEYLYSLRGKKYRVKHQIPKFYDRKLAFLKYLILLITLITSVFGVAWIYILACPMNALAMLPRLAAPGLLLLAAILVLALFVERAWCRFLCPYAALMNLFERIGSIVGIKRRKIMRNLERCTDCGVCNLYCPMNIDLLADEYVHDPNCIQCGLCAEKCPKGQTVVKEKE